MASWRQILLSIAEAYKERRDELEHSANEIVGELRRMSLLEISAGGLKPELLDSAFTSFSRTFDRTNGGFGGAPKFPPSMSLEFLLRYHYRTGNETALEMVSTTLDKMAGGVMYDQLGGGFHRYSVDAVWLVPHFEKMLYDNALLVPAYLEAYQLTGAETYKAVIEETLQFVARELLHPDGGFYSALDADSEGEEGKFYVWDFEEVQKLLGADAPLFCAYYDIRPGGNWEGKNILFVKTSLADFARMHNVDMGVLKSLLQRGKEKLLQERNNRIRPGLDDKILLGWNALMNTAYSKAYAATGHEDFKKLAVRNMQFLLKAFDAGDGKLFHTWKADNAKYPAFLDDYSYLIAALIQLAQITGDGQWLHKAAAFTEVVLQGFSDTQTPLFYFTHASQTDILIRKKEVYDGATPSGNAMMALNLFQLSILLDKPEWQERAENMLAAMGGIALKYPTSFGVWLHLVLQITYGTEEIAIVGEIWQTHLKSVLHLYLPHKVLMAAAKENPNFPLLRGKEGGAQTLLYLCQNYACQRPVASLAEFKRLILSNSLEK